MHVLGSGDDGVVQVQFDTEQSEPGLAVAQAVAEIDDRDPTDLTSIWGCVDHVVDHVFSDPPDAEANVEVSFDYEGYRVTLRQDGEAVFVPLSEQ